MVQSKKYSKLIFLNILLILFLWIVAGGLKISAQQLSSKIAFENEEIRSYVIKEFSNKEINNKVYFRFLVVENRSNTSYTLESSINGTDFTEIKSKEGFKSPNNTPLLYCFQDVLDGTIKKTYRVKISTPENTEYSSVISINSAKSSFFAQKE